MPFDALTLSAVRQEIESKYGGGRIQGLAVPGPLTVSLELYRAGSGRSHLIMSAHPQHARLYLAGTTPTRDPNEHPSLLLLLRKYVRGGTLVDVSQPPHERVVALSIAKRIPPDKHQEYHFGDDFRHSPHEDEEEEEDLPGPVRTVRLIVEVMGRQSNIVLVDEDGLVLDSIKRIPPSINRYRTTLPRHPYVPPPPQGKRDPLHTTINALSLELHKAAEADAPAPAWKGLVSGFLGISPTLAREASFRAFGAVDTPAAGVASTPELLTTLLGELQALLMPPDSADRLSSVAWKPQEGAPAGEGMNAVDFAPYPLLHLQDRGLTLVSYGGISEAASAYFLALGSLGGHSALRGQVQADLDAWRKREERKLSQLRGEWQRAQALDELRHRGEMLLAYMHLIQPGQEQLAIPEEQLTIELDPALTPVEQAQAIFKEYRKARSGMAELPTHIRQTEQQLAYVDEMQTSLDLAASYDEIRAVQTDLKGITHRPSGMVEATCQKAPKKRKDQPKLPQPLRLRTRLGSQILLGRTAGQNDTATFRLAAPEDLWFHARGVPGAHVILRAGEGLTQEDIQEAASYAAAYSKAATEAQVDVVWTEKKHVRRVPNAPPGFVTFRNERVLRVAPRAKQRV